MDIQRIIAAASFALMISGSAGSPAEFDGKPFRIGKNEGNSIFVAPGGDARSKFRQAAAADLAEFLRRGTGAEIPVVSDEAKLKGKDSGVIYIGDSKFTNEHKLGSGVGDFGPGGFLIKTVGGNLAILGCDTDFGAYAHRADGDSGTVSGVMAFLEDFAGVRFLWPGEIGAVVPKKDLIIVPAFTEIRRRPAILYRRIDEYAEVQARLLPDGKIKFWAGLSGDHFKEWSLFLRRQGCGKFLSVHASHMRDVYLRDSDFESHPEWFAFYNGKRRPHKETSTLDYGGAQVCQSNKDLPGVLAERIAAEAAKLKGDAARRTFSLSPCDGSRFCVCDKCKELDKGAEPWREGDNGWGHLPGEIYNEKFGIVSDLSNRIWTFNNEVARKVAGLNPNIMLACYAYSFFRKPPKSVPRIEDNLMVIFTDEKMGNGTESERGEEARLFLEWSKKARHLGMYSYYYMIGPRPHLAAEIVRYTHNLGSLTHNSEASQTFGFKWIHYVAHIKAMWNPYLNVDALILDYYNAAYGAGAPAMLKYLALQERVSMSYNTFDTFQAPEETCRAWSPAVRAELRGYLNEALKAAASSREHRDRICFTESAWEMLDSYCELHSSLVRLKSLGMAVPCVKTSDHDPEAKPEDLRKAIENANRQWLRLRGVMEAAEMSESFSIPWLHYFVYAGSREGEVIYSWSNLIENLGKQVLENGGIPLPALWKFQLDPKGDGRVLGWEKTDCNDTQWPSISTDECWEKQGYGPEKFPENGKEGYNGKAWYRLNARIPEESRGKRVILELGAVDESCAVWINGKFAGESKYDVEKDPELWRKPRDFDISNLVEFGKDNCIAVEVEDKSGAGGIWKPCFILFKPVTPAGAKWETIPMENQFWNSGELKPWYAETEGGAKVAALKKKRNMPSL